MKSILTLLLLIPLTSYSQNIEQQLDSINSAEDAITYLKSNTSDDIKLYIFNREKHKTRLTDDLFKLSKGGKKVTKTEFTKTYYKVLEKAEVDHYRFKIIVIDAKNTSNAAAKSIRNKVLSQYKEGYTFNDLAKHHSTGPTAKRSGDTGWMKIGEISEEFDEKAFDDGLVINDVITVDDIKNKKYYIVMKTEDKKPIEEITVLKFTVDIE